MTRSRYLLFSLLLHVADLLRWPGSRFVWVGKLRIRALNLAARILYEDP